MTTFRLDAGAGYASTCALLVCQPGNQWWNGTSWVAASSLTPAQAYTSNGAAIIPGVQETISDSSWNGSYTYAFPTAALASIPAGTQVVKAVIFSGAFPVEQTAIGEDKYPVAFGTTQSLQLQYLYDRFFGQVTRNWGGGNITINHPAPAPTGNSPSTLPVVNIGNSVTVGPTNQ
jgi:hypothetical protein